MNSQIHPFMWLHRALHLFDACDEQDTSEENSLNRRTMYKTERSFTEYFIMQGESVEKALWKVTDRVAHWFMGSQIANLLQIKSVFIG